jgi:hypothetical protein
MTKSNLTKKLVSLACVGVSVLTMSASAFAVTPETEAPATSEPVTISSTSSVTRAYVYEWRYTIIDGRGMKRQWNITINRWEGEWIPM